MIWYWYFCDCLISLNKSLVFAQVCYSSERKGIILRNATFETSKEKETVDNILADIKEGQRDGIKAVGPQGWGPKFNPGNSKLTQKARYHGMHLYCQHSSGRVGGRDAFGPEAFRPACLACAAWQRQHKRVCSNKVESENCIRNFGMWAVAVGVPVFTPDTQYYTYLSIHRQF